MTASLFDVPDTYQRLIFVLEGYARHTPCMWDSVFTPEQAESWIEKTLEGIVEEKVEDELAEERYVLLRNFLDEGSEICKHLPSGFFDDGIDDADEASATHEGTVKVLTQVVEKLAGGQVKRLAILDAVLDEIDARLAYSNDAPLSSRISDARDARDWVNRIFDVFAAEVAKKTREER
jgi:hypothetical protein